LHYICWPLFISLLPLLLITYHIPVYLGLFDARHAATQKEALSLITHITWGAQRPGKQLLLLILLLANVVDVIKSLIFFSAFAKKMKAVFQFFFQTAVCYLKGALKAAAPAERIAREKGNQSIKNFSLAAFIYS
jgi:hypothetical protein